MVFRALIVLSVIVFRLCVAQKLDLPNAVPTCKRDSDDYNSCLKQAIEEAWPLFVKGLPAEYDFPPLDPYNYGYEKAVFDTAGIIHGEAVFSNLTVEGIKTIRFETVKSHFNNNNFRLEIDTSAPKILSYGDCDSHGDVGGIKVRGRGQVYLTMEDVKTTWDISGPVKNDIWIIKHFRASPMINKLNVKMENFLGGNKEMSDLAVNFVNDNWPPIYRTMVPIMNKLWDTHAPKLLNRLFSKLSFSKVFP